LNKQRHGDRDVEVSVADVGAWKTRTMVEAAAKLHATGMRAPVCIGVHALFDEDAYDLLMAAGAERIVTCNTVAHATNAIDVFPDIANAVGTTFAPGGWEVAEVD
jgi:ribose-phosphate pyrophosphokinase